MLFGLMLQYFVISINIWLRRIGCKYKFSSYMYIIELNNMLMTKGGLNCEDIFKKKSFITSYLNFLLFWLEYNCYLNLIIIFKNIVI